ncbi:MAG: phosphatidylglycerophosphatase A [Rheinheimera sp.]|jgi:phosphatidylglycerophosphatase A|nr:phosphatidylglycerophosphatase A [Rheinheimera sp.]
MATHPFNLAKWQHWLALGLGSGLAPKAPGTFGTLAAVPLVVILSFFSSWVVIGFLLALSLLAVYVCQVVTNDIGVEDHGSIVIDEVVGFAITMWAVPLDFIDLCVGFALFRLFDIVKPWPIRWFDRNIHGGLGIMLDDIVAGILACAVLHSVWLPFIH